MASNASDVVHGTYRVSRLPGHPLYEGVYSVAVALGGPLLSNLLTVSLSLVLLRVVFLLGEAVGVRGPGWAVVALAAQPIFWVSSADSMDFILATLLGTSAVLAAVCGRSGACGALLGMAAATRIETVLFAIPVAILGRGLRLRQVVTVACVVVVVLFGPIVVAIYNQNWQGWLLNVFLMPRMEVKEWFLMFASRAWATWGLISLIVVAGTIVVQRRRLMCLIHDRDRLLLAVGLLSGAYFAMTLIHPSKSTYYVPLLPLVVLAVTHVASNRQRLLVILSFLTYAVVYPDVVDRVDGKLQLGFRWNNGIVVKEWIARWNTTHAASVIEQNRFHGPSVLILGYWLPVWRYEHGDSVAVARLADRVSVDLTLNAAYRSGDGAWIVHNLDRVSVDRLAGEGVRLTYGEGVDAFLREIHGYDVEKYGAVEVPVRSFGTGISEHFTVPVLVRCSFARVEWEACVKGRIGREGVASGEEARQLAHVH
jgi:hypothetical protein